MGRKKVDAPVRTFGASLDLSAIEEVQAIADKRKWSAAFAGGELIKLGLEIHRRTQKIEVPAEVIKAYPLTAQIEPQSKPTPTVHAPAPKPKPLRDSPSYQKAMHFGKRGAKSDADKQLSESEFERLRREQNGTEGDEE